MGVEIMNIKNVYNFSKIYLSAKCFTTGFHCVEFRVSRFIICYNDNYDQKSLKVFEAEIIETARYFMRDSMTWPALAMYIKYGKQYRLFT